MSFDRVLYDEPPPVEPTVVASAPPVLNHEDYLAVQQTRLRNNLARFDLEIDRMLDEAKSLTISDNATRAHGVNLAGTANKLNKSIESAREEFKRPALEFGRAVDNLSKSYQTRLKAIVDEIKGKDRQYQAKIDLAAAKQREAARKAQEDLQKKIDAEAKKAGVEAPQVQAPVIVEPPRGVKTEAGAISYRTVWKFKVDKPELVPDKYKVIDERLINHDVKAGIREIPGVIVFEEKEPVRR